MLYVVLGLGGTFVVLMIFLVGMAAVVGSAASETASQAPEPPPLAPARPAPAPEPATAAEERRPSVQISAVDLFKAYQENEVSADKRFQDRLLIVSGKVSSVDKSFGSVVVQIASSNEFMPVGAELEDSESNQAGRLAKGDSVRVVCKSVSKVLGPRLDGCTFR